MEISHQAQYLEQKIEAEYERRANKHPNNKLGWRLLYSPSRVLCNARVAFLGFNPGGDRIDPNHGVFSSEAGSAYRKEVETWGKSSGLQEQVLELFRRLDEKPEDVLAGNLVPFRSPDEKSLEDKDEAIQFGKDIWRGIFEIAEPNIVVSMGKTANCEVSKMLNVQEVGNFPVNWGLIKVCRANFSRGTWIGLPHLSRYSVMRREASRAALDQAFEGLN